MSTRTEKVQETVERTRVIAVICDHCGREIAFRPEGADRWVGTQVEVKPSETLISYWRDLCDACSEELAVWLTPPGQEKAA